jgi:hypothetical protein
MNKKLQILLAAFVLSTSVLFAQLYISPAGGLGGGTTDAEKAAIAAATAHPAASATHTTAGLASVAALVDLSGVTNATAARAVLSVPTVAEAQAMSANNSLELYFSEQNDPAIASCEQMLTTPVVTLASETPPKTVTSTIGLMDQWISPSGGLGMTQLNAGVINVTRRALKGAGADVRVTGELWIMDAAQVLTFVASTTGTLMTADNTEIVISNTFTVGAAIPMALTDRLIERQYAITVGVGGNSTLTNWYGGVKQGYLTIPRASQYYALLGGSSTQNFSVATLTIGNISGWTYVNCNIPVASNTASGTEFTFIGYTKNNDTNNEFDPTTGVFTAGHSGLFFTALIAGFEANAVGPRLCAVKHGIYYAAASQSGSAPSGAATYLTCSGLVWLSAGEQLSCVGMQGGGTVGAFVVRFVVARLQ